MNRKPSVLSILSSSTLQSNVILPSLRESYDYLCKVIIIGPSGSGKTCLLKKFLDKPASVSKQTIGVEFHSKIIEVEQNMHLKLQLWDTAGQERFKSITTSYYRGSAGVVLCFDLTREESLFLLERDLQDIKDLTDYDIISCLIVGNKCDLVDDIKVTQPQLVEFSERMKQKFALDISIIYECSSITGDNVNQVFETIGSKILDKIEKGIIDVRDLNSGVQLGNEMITHSDSNMNLDIRGRQETRNSNCCF